MTTSLKFGTSGLRGLAADLSGAAARRYTAAFLRHLAQGQPAPSTLYLGRDRRASSAGIMRDCAAAAAALGVTVVDLGILAAPALACHAMAAASASVMVTGSHIPADRNGLKFFRASGEISKADEIGIVQQLRDAEPGDYAATPQDESALAQARYLSRYAGILGPQALSGRRIGVYEHSTAGNAALAAIFAGFGAEIILLGRVEQFVAVDTEAFADAVFAPLPGWLRQHRLDAIISADGDADRPLLLDDQANFVRGDVMGLLAARFFGADTVVTPVTSNTAIEATGFFPKVLRTKVGSPYVIAGMNQALAAGAHCVFGFEANGGTLLGSPLRIGDKHVPALPTRDAILPLIGVLGAAAAKNCAISELVKTLPLRVALSDRLEQVASARSAALLHQLLDRPAADDYFATRGAIARIANIDGVQIFLDDGVMLHYRASGNAPELRCYVEAATPLQAQQALDWGLNAARDWLAQH